MYALLSTLGTQVWLCLRVQSDASHRTRSALSQSDQSRSHASNALPRQDLRTKDIHALLLECDIQVFPFPQPAPKFSSKIAVEVTASRVCTQIPDMLDAPDFDTTNPLHMRKYADEMTEMMSSALAKQARVHHVKNVIGALGDRKLTMREVELVSKGLHLPSVRHKLAVGKFAHIVQSRWSSSSAGLSSASCDLPALCLTWLCAFQRNLIKQRCGRAEN